MCTKMVTILLFDFAWTVSQVTSLDSVYYFFFLGDFLETGELILSAHEWYRLR
ncbi:hypothetical protein SAMN04488124_2497 [Halogeometricum limi]|uniref:Uncharacterized protein n=1 Tax=Halogeometricum limi TaxID=555875 RepID=A0A1I6HV56_9EURY|nr:hypothetical protein SAMN04488124_2497 [Halogeometricum limi]